MLLMVNIVDQWVQQQIKKEKSEKNLDSSWFCSSFSEKNAILKIFKTIKISRIKVIGRRLYDATQQKYHWPKYLTTSWEKFKENFHFSSFSETSDKEFHEKSLIYEITVANRKRRNNIHFKCIECMFWCSSHSL